MIIKIMHDEVEVDGIDEELQTVDAIVTEHINVVHDEEAHILIHLLHVVTTLTKLVLVIYH